MKPTITILDYLWSGRKTWLRCNEGCTCDFEDISVRYIEDTMTVDQWICVEIDNGTPALKLLKRTSDEWSDICGPDAEKRQLQQQLDAYMEEVTAIISLQAARERLSGE